MRSRRNKFHPRFHPLLRVDVRSLGIVINVSKYIVLVNSEQSRHPCIKKMPRLFTFDCYASQRPKIFWEWCKLVHAGWSTSPNALLHHLMLDLPVSWRRIKGNWCGSCDVSWDCCSSKLTAWELPWGLLRCSEAWQIIGSMNIWSYV